MVKKRICSHCNSEKEKGKHWCRNSICPESIIYKEQKEKNNREIKNILKDIMNQIVNEEKKEKKRKKQMERKKIREEKKKKKEEEKERKRVEKERQKKLRAPKAGTSVKGRDGSTRHGMAVSFSSYHAPKITEYDIDNRNTILEINPNKCFWCKKKNKECGDHAHPCCNTTYHEYGTTNALNIVPSCHSCNSKKGGKQLEAWIDILEWPEEEKIIYKKWLYENKEKLLFNEEDTIYLERQFIIINDIHSILEYCAKHKKEVCDYITVKTPNDL